MATDDVDDKTGAEEADPPDQSFPEAPREEDAAGGRTTAVRCECPYHRWSEAEDVKRQEP